MLLPRQHVLGKWKTVRIRSAWEKFSDHIKSQNVVYIGLIYIRH